MGIFTPPAGEKTILENDYVSLNGTNGSAVLTDQHIYHITTGFFGGIKDVNKLPLRQIQIENGKAQVTVKFAVLEGSKLVVRANNRTYTYAFTNTLTNEAKKWGDYITQKLTGYTADVEQTGEIAEVASQIKGTIDAFKGAFGVKSMLSSNEKVNGKCNACRAPISGNKGSVVRCPYCDTEQKL